jgi:hypothetical protein
MRRILVLALAATLAATSWAQAAFTIRRPTDGSTVRETVSFRVPKNSMPDGGFLGVYVNDKFLEAAMPTLEGADYVYRLDTQAHKFADGMTKVELVLFQEVGGKQRILARSSVNVRVDNATSIRVPSNGMRLRYKFAPGTERTYVYKISQDVQTVSQAQARLGSRGFTTSAEEETVRILHAVDNSYTASGLRQGLIRVQIVPDKGKDYATIIPPGTNESKKIGSEEMDPIYMRVDELGREVYSALPLYFGIDGTNGSPPVTSYFPLIPMFVLPANPVKPGAVWRASQLMSTFDGDDLGTMREKERFMRALPSRGEFEGVLWYRNIPCAKLVSTLALGQGDLRNVRDLNQIEGEAQRVELKEVLYLAIDRGIPVRREISITQESLIEQAPRQAQTGGGSGNAPTAAGAAGGGPSAAGAASGGGGQAGSANWQSEPPPFLPGDFEFRPTWSDDGMLSFFQQTRGGRGGGRRGGPAGIGDGDGELQRNPGAAGGAGQGGGFGQRTAGGGAQKVIVRVTMKLVAELER